MDSDELKNKAARIWESIVTLETDKYDYEQRKLDEGGAEVLRAELVEQMWKDKHTEWTKRPKARLPKWFGERPGKKAGAPDTPEGEEAAEEAAEEEYDEEEEEYDEEEYDEEEEEYD